MRKLASRQYSFLLLLALFTISIASDSFSQTQNITDGQTLVSEGGSFELGFFGSTARRYVGIWFKVSVDTVVWVANRDNPLNDSSGALAFNDKGNLVLLDGKSSIVWSSNTTNAISPMVQLLDSGNLVLKGQSSTDSSGSVIWQSFDYPTNTLLPEMKVGKDLRTGVEWSLSSWSSNQDPSRGDYHYNMDTRGSPELFLWHLMEKKYRTGPWNGLRFSGIPEMTTFEDMFNFNFVSNSDEIYYGFTAKDGSPLSRVVLNETGVMQRLVWDQNYQTWNSFWSGPKDQCDYYAKCGPFGVCNANDATVCSCLMGFNPKSPSGWYMRDTSGGCIRRTHLDCSPSDGFNLLTGVKLPVTHNTTVDAGISLDECRSRCLSNCSCVAYAATDIRGGGSGCIVWTGELIDIRFIDGGQDLYVKVAKSDLGTTASKGRKRNVALITIMTIVLVMLLLTLGFLVWKKTRRNKKQVGRTYYYCDESGCLKDPELPVFDLETIKLSTNNFSETNKLGEGGFGSVYKGQLQNGQEIAVKRRAKDSSQGVNEFMNEVVLIAKLQHKNLVRLLGCCIHGNERMLIYEYMSNKSLDFVIFDERRRASLNWRVILEITLGVARGVLYLHEDSRVNIIHRDLKAANILLDEQMIPKISDFGTARLFGGDQMEIDTATVVGTRGYMSPEYAMDGRLSVKSDVYSFGVLLLEIISGKRNQGLVNLIAYAWMLWEEGNIAQLIDQAVGGPCPTSELLRYIQVGLLCVQECPDDRPAMSAIMLMLASEDSALPEPKKPVVCNRMVPLNPELAILTHQLYSINELTITGVEGR
ncbi:receptor-like serine/threonine-protein kinase SD1-8 isoform X2 [Typha angustifolia]|uniref:receptor-like serine/threonine-protein kinase SD1-8 isoform X2 n=1 Tax=Typha angustifolia TaxID=59011 RepID=UPI003C2FBC79